MKQCTKCKIIKNVNEFSKCNRNVDGYQYICKECNNLITKEYRRTKKGLIVTIYAHQKENAKKRNMILPTYTKIDLKNWLFSQELFHKLYDEWVKSGYLKDLVPSVDRIDDYKSYTMDNIQLMTFKENYKRSHNDAKNGINNKQSKTVYQYTKENVFIKEFYSLSEAGRKTDTNHQNISMCCNSKRKTAGGYIWKYHLK